MNSGIRILFLEDSPADRELIERELDRAGIASAVRVVATKSDFLRQLQEFQPDLILSDYELPNFNGLEALLLLKESGAHLPFILVTGSMTEEVAVECMKQGADDYILKTGLVRLPGAIRRAMEKSEAERQRREMIDALRQSEERYRAFVENSSEAIWRFELERPLPVDLPLDEQLERLYAEGRLAECNNAMAAMYGYDRAEEIVGARIGDLLAQSSQENDALFRAFVGAGYRLADAETTERDREGNTKYFLNNFVGIVEEGFLRRVWGTQRDVTERKQTEAALRQRDEQLRLSQKLEAVGRLAGGIAHDFNNLLTVINGYSELLLRRLGEEDPLRPSVGEIRKAGERAGALTRQLLAFSRKQVLQPKVLDLNGVISDVESMLKRLIGEDVELISVQQPGLGYVQADPGQIEQVLLNLVVNARDAMPRGGKIIIEAHDVELDAAYASRRAAVQPGRYVLLAVSDNGHGMDIATQARIFEPFFTTKEIGKGTGLGLSTVYGIIKQSGGYIWVYSEVGQGTTFKIYLPRVEEAPKDDIPTVPVLPVESPVRGRETILLVEDEEIVRELAARLLREQNYQVLVAAEGEEALRVMSAQLAAGGRVDLLLTDVVMPRMSGRDLAERLRATRPQLKVLYMSGYTDDAMVHHGVLQKGVAFLEKPFTPAELIARIRAVLDAPAG